MGCKRSSDYRFTAYWRTLSSTPMDLDPVIIQAGNTQEEQSVNLSLTLMWEPDDDYHYINARRTEYYPPDLLFNPVHVSLFTRLTVPPDLRAQVKDDISRIACEQASF